MKTFKFQGEDYQVLYTGIVNEAGFVSVDAFRIVHGFVRLITLKYRYRDGVTEVDRISLTKWDLGRIENAIVAANNESALEINDTDIVPQSEVTMHEAV